MGNVQRPQVAAGIIAEPRVKATHLFMAHCLYFGGVPFWVSFVCLSACQKNNWKCCVYRFSKNVGNHGRCYAWPLWSIGIMQWWMCGGDAALCQITLDTCLLDRWKNITVFVLKTSHSDTEQVRVQPPTSAVNVTLPAFAAAAPCTAGAVAAERRRLLSIDISCWLGAEQQTRRRPWLLSIDGTDRRTDGSTLAYYAGSVNNRRL